MNEESLRSRFNLSHWAVTHRSLILFLIIGTLISGAVAFSKLGRLEDPNFNVPTMNAVVAWPGAPAQAIQDQVLNRMERELQEIEGIDYLHSFSRQGFGGLNLWMKGGTPKEELENAWYQARKKINDVRHEFPQGVLGPFYNDEFSDVYSLLYAVVAPELSMVELQNLAEDLKRSIQSVAGVKRVDLVGKQAEKIYVEFSSARLAALGVSPRQLLDSLAAHNRLAPAGSFEGAHDRVYLRSDRNGGVGLQSAKDVAMLPIEAGGRLLRLGDVAEVRQGIEDPPQFTVRAMGQPVVVLAVAFERKSNILKIGKALDHRIEALKASLPVGVGIEKLADQPKIVEASVWEFERSFLEALAIVLAVCFIFLGWRTGIVVAATVPLVLALVAVVMLMMGWSLDRVSLGALIIALGLLVDDAIIAVEMMVVKIEQGWDRVKAAGFAYTSTAFPMLTGTLVTVAGFIPVGFARSISGEYAGGIFWVVGVSLLASWVVAVLFTPYLGVLMLPKTFKHQAHDSQELYQGRVYRSLRRVIEIGVAHRFKVLAVTGLAFGLAAGGMTAVQQQFFPTASRLELIVDLRMREGSSFVATETQVKRLEQILKSDPQVAQFTAYTGAGAPRFFLSISADLPNPGFAQIIINTRSIEDREAVRARLLELFAKQEDFPDLKARVTRFEFGPPVGYPVQFRVIGPQAEGIREIANQVRETLRTSPLLRDVELDWNEKVRSLHVDLDLEKAQSLGISRNDVNAMTQLMFGGFAVTQTYRGEALIDIVLRAKAEDRHALERVGDLLLYARNGQAVPLSQIARIEPSFEEPVLWRRNRELTMTVRADVRDGVQGPAATAQVSPSLDNIRESLAPGYRIEIGGAAEETEKSDSALFAVFPMMFAIIFLVLMIQLQSFSRMMIVFMTAPLALIGVVPALLITQAPFGFVALLGVIALGGMIMRNSVILVDQIDHEVANGMALDKAIVEATVRRARPVVLTAAAAVMAMIPLTRSVFWGPMAIAIMGGLIVGTALTLIVVPALYAAWFKRGAAQAPASGSALASAAG